MTTFHRVMPVLEVSDVVASAKWYEDTLGFTHGGFFGDPPAFCIVGSPTMTIALDQCQEPGRTPQNQYWAAYIYIDRVDALAEEMRKKGIEILRGPEDQPYGCRDFDIRDPDGHILALGEDLIPSERGPGL